MNKVIAVSLVSFFCLVMQNSYALESAPVNAPSSLGTEGQGLAGQLAQEFSHTVISGIEATGNLQLSQAEISSKIDDYAVRLAEILFAAGLSDKIVSSIMAESAFWYTEALKVVFRNGNVDEAMQGFSAKMALLLEGEQLDIDTQEKIIFLTVENLSDLKSIINYE